MVDILGLKDELLGTIQANSTAIKVGTVSALAGGALAAGAVAISQSRKKRAKPKSKNRKSSYKHKSSKRKYKYARTAGKSKDRSTRRIRMTKSGQPYIILKSGKARFISKKSASLSRKRKGGRY